MNGGGINSKECLELITYGREVSWLNDKKMSFGVKPLEGLANNGFVFVDDGNGTEFGLEGMEGIEKNIGWGEPELVVEDGFGMTKQTREVTKRDASKGRVFKWLFSRLSPLQAARDPQLFSPTLCWQDDNDDDDGCQTWFQFRHAHSMKPLITVVQVENVHASINGGIHLVVEATWAVGASIGPTLARFTSMTKVGGDKIVYYDEQANGELAEIKVICEVMAQSVIHVQWLEEQIDLANENLVHDLQKINLNHDVDPTLIADDIQSLSPSDDDDDDDEEELVPFDTESYGLSEPLVSKEVVAAALCTMKLEVQKALLYLCHLLRFVMYGDYSGMKTSEVLQGPILEGLASAMMQRGDGLCIVVQRMVPCIVYATLAVPTSQVFHGGVLMQLLFVIEEIYRTKQINVNRIMVEDAPDNLFAHMDGTGLSKAVLGEKLISMYGANLTTGPSMQIPMPYLAEMEMPKLDYIDVKLINNLFKNAPHLAGLAKEMCAPKFLRKIDGYIGQKKAGKLRKYQDYCVSKVASGENYVFVAPTGAGKTKIFVEAARSILEKDNTGTVVVICPTVPLATQQACVFVVEGFLEDRFWVNVFSSDNQLKPEAWSVMERTHNVMVMTPQLMLNVMEHEAKNRPLESGNSVFYDIDLMVLDECHHTRKEHPFNKIMREYNATPDSKMQVLGFTASPAKSKTEEECREQLGNLLTSLGASMVVITEENQEVKSHVPGAKEIEIWVEPRREDAVFSRALGQLVMRVCKKFVIPLVGRVEGLRRLPEQCMVSFAKGERCPFFESWCQPHDEMLEKNEDLEEDRKVDLMASLKFLHCCNTSLDIQRDAGFESAMRYLAKTAMDLALRFNGISDFHALMFPKIVAGFYCIEPIQSALTVLEAFQVSPIGLSERYPRFVELVKFLESYSKNEKFHGIVFIKTRDGVYHLAHMLRNHPQLRFLKPMEFVGHGARRKKTMSSTCPFQTAAESAKRGMTGNKQRDILSEFGKPGRHVLIATSAAEEGINVPTCEFVVRYTAAETGIQRVQSRGRTRVQGALFVNILERESRASELHLGAVHQEEILNKVLRSSDQVEHV